MTLDVLTEGELTLLFLFVMACGTWLLVEVFWLAICRALGRVGDYLRRPAVGWLEADHGIAQRKAAWVSTPVTWVDARIDQVRIWWAERRRAFEVSRARWRRRFRRQVPHSRSGAA